MTGSEPQDHARERDLGPTGIPLAVLRDRTRWSYFLEHGHVPEQDGCPSVALEELDLLGLVQLGAHLRRTGEGGVLRPRIWRLVRERLAGAAGAEIVRALEHDSVYFKDACGILEAREPDADAARAIVAGHDAGGLPSWLAAALLQAARHRAGYDKVVEILGRGDGQLSESYAAGAALRIAGPACEPDLTRAIDEVEHGLTRRAAARMLGSIAGDSALAFLLSAVERGRLRAKSVAEGLLGSSVEPEWLVLAMTSGHREVRRIAPMLIAARLRARDRGDERVAHELDRCARSSELRQALRATIEEGEETVWRADRDAIERWLARG